MAQRVQDIGKPFIALPEVDSTNNYAMARVSEGPVDEGTTWFAWRQTAGKGQRGKTWQSEPGENVMLSVVLKPLMLKPSEQFMLSASVALALRELVQNRTDRPVKIKWSNDIYIDDKKAGGILIENVIRGNAWKNAIVGIGLNVNQQVFPENLPNPVSLSLVTGIRYDVLEVARGICAVLDRYYRRLEPAGFPDLLADYTRHLYRLGEFQRFREAGGKYFQARILGVEKDGKLRLEPEEGPRFSVALGEVVFLTEETEPPH